MDTDDGTGLRIGWSSVDITPEDPVILRGQFHARVSQGVRDPVTATALALERDGVQSVMVSVDRVSIPDDIRAAVRDVLSTSAPGLDPSQVSMSATHTHTAPATDDSKWEDQGPEVMKPSAYADMLVERLAQCVADAWRGRSAGAVAWGLGHAVVGHNRRQVGQDGSARMYGDTSASGFSHIEGYEDHNVDLLFTYDEAGAFTGLIVNLACPSQVSESDYLISADFWHDTRLELRRRFGSDLHVLAQCSAAGDQSPHLMWYRKAEMRMLRLQGLIEREDVSRPTEQRRDIARRIADAVDFVLPLASKEMTGSPILRHSVETLHLPRRRITIDDVEEAKQEIAAYDRRLRELSDRPPSDPERSRCFGRRRWYQGVIDRYELQHREPDYPMELHVVRLGDVAFATNAFELYLDFGVRMKAASPAIQTFVVQLAGSGTYLPSERSTGGGSYGSVPASNHVGPDAGDLIVDRTVGLLDAMFDEGRASSGAS